MIPTDTQMTDVSARNMVFPGSETAFDTVAGLNTFHLVGRWHSARSGRGGSWSLRPQGEVVRSVTPAGWGDDNPFGSLSQTRKLLANCLPLV